MSLTINHQTNDISATSGSVTIDGSAVGGGGGVTTFTGLSGTDGTPSGATYANVAALPSTGNTAGDLAYVTTGSNSKPSLYIWNGHGWFKIDDVNTTPTMNDLGSDPVRINASSDSTITITASDVDEDTTLQYKYQVTTGSLPSGANITTTSDVSITENSYVSSNQFKVNIGATTGSFTLTFTVTDGINTSSDTIDIAPPAIVSSNLILHVDAGLSSTIQDHSGNGNTVSKTSGVDFTTAGTGGVASYWTFDNIADYIDTNVQRTNSDFSYSAWFSFDSLTSLNNVLISTFESTSQEWTTLNANSTGYAEFIIDNDGDNTGGDAVKVTLTDTTTQMSSGTWYNMCATYNSTSGVMKLYLNGSQVATTTHSQTGTITGVEPIRIGGRSSFTSSTERWIGDIAVVLTYSKELSSTEVTQNWNAYKGRYGL